MKTVSQIRALLKLESMGLLRDREAPTRPCRNYRIAVQPCKQPYNFKRAKARRKMAKVSRRINRSR